MNFSPIYKIKEGKLSKVKSWLKELAGGRRAEAVSTFEYENIVREGYVLFEVNEKENYLIGFNESSNNHTKKGDMSVEINKEHYSFKKECLVPMTRAGITLLDLKL